MGKQTSSRRVNPARYEELLREELENYNAELGPKEKRITWFDAMLSRSRATSRMRWRVFKKLRDMGFSLPAIGQVSGFNHTTILHGLFWLHEGSDGTHFGRGEKEMGRRLHSASHGASLNNSARMHRSELERTADASPETVHHSP